MTPVRWGILGAGRIAHQFAQDIAFAPSAELVAVAARSGAAAEIFALQHDIGIVHAGYKALYADPNVDAIYIATPHSLHAEQVRACAEHGKAVLCEKPLVTTPRECADLIEVLRGSDVYMMEAMWTWFLPAIRQARTWVDSGSIGDLVRIQADFGYPLPYDPNRREWDNRLGGGCLLEMGIYPVALHRLFSPAPWRGLNCLGQRAGNGVERDVVATLDCGRHVSVLGTSFDARLGNSALIIGTDGYIEIPDFFRASRASLFRLDERIDHFQDDREGGGFEFEIEAASRDILLGRRQSGTVTWEDSQAFQDLMQAIRQAL